MLNKNEIHIITQLMKGKNYTFNEISEEFDVSSRSARYYIDNIDFILKVLGYKITTKDKQQIFLDTSQNFNKIIKILNETNKLSLEDRKDLLKLILFFDYKNFNITNFTNKIGVSRTTVKKDLKEIEKELNKENCFIEYRFSKGYRLVGDKEKLLLKQEELVEKILKYVDVNSINNIDLMNTFYMYVKIETIEKIKKFIRQVQKKMKLNINNENYNKIVSYIITFIYFPYDEYDNVEDKNKLIAKNFLLSTDEFIEIKEMLLNTFFNIDFKEEMILRILDLIFGISINNFHTESFTNWINEEFMIRKMIVKISKIIGKDLMNDYILYQGLFYHIKPAMYRMKNNITISNSVFKELIYNNDPILAVVKEGIKEIEDLFDIIFPEDEISLLGFHIKAAIDRNENHKEKKVILVCGLGYGSSKVLEQSLKENYSIDIIDVISYTMIKKDFPNYNGVDAILTTVDIDHTIDVPVIKINPLLDEFDKKVLNEYGIHPKKGKVSLKKIMNIIENNAVIDDRDKLVSELLSLFNNQVIQDLDKEYNSFFKYFNDNNVKYMKRVNSWKDAIKETGKILIKNGNINENHVNKMIQMVEKYGGYIVIEEGLAMPHAEISSDIKKSGMALLILEETVYFDNGKGANIFVSFATTNKKEQEEILKNLFDLITKEKFIEKVKKIKNYKELLNIFRRNYVT